MSTQRFIRGQASVIDLPKLAADAIQAGDVLYWSVADSAARPASAATGVDHAARAAVVGTNFVGIAMADRDAGDTSRVPVATDGDAIFAVAGTPTVMSLVRVVDNAGSPSRTNIESTAVPAQAIGRTLSLAAGGRIEVRINSRFNWIA